MSKRTFLAGQNVRHVRDELRGVVTGTREQDEPFPNLVAVLEESGRTTFVPENQLALDPAQSPAPSAVSE